MTSRPSDAFPSSQSEIALLVERLHATDQRLEELLVGEVDTVTDRQGRTMLLRRAQGELRQSELARQSAILGALPAHIALLNARGTIVSVNTAWRHFGVLNNLLSPGHAVGQNYLEICDLAQGTDSAEAQQVAKGIRQVLAGEIDSFSMEYPCHSPTEQRWFQIVVTPLAGCPPTGAVVQHTNITERKQAADQLAELSARTDLRERMLSTLLSSISDCAYIYDRDGRLLFANRPMLDLWGIPLEQALGRRHSDFGHPCEVAEKFQQAVQEVVRNAKSLSFDAPFGGSAHSERFFEHLYSPVLAADGSVEFVVGTTRDISERKHIQDKLHAMNTELELRVASRTAALVRQEALFHALADQAPVIIWTMDASCSHISYINRAGSDLLGGKPEDWIGQNGLPIHPGDIDANTRGLAQATERSEPFVSVRRLAAADGRFRIMSCMVSPVYGPQGTADFWVGLDQDITELKEVETALRLSNSELGTFAHAIAHDLRSPLSVIGGFGAMLEKELGKTATPRAIHLLSRLRAGVHQMDEVTNGLLALSGLSRSAIKMELTDLSKMAREVAELLQERNPERVVVFSIQQGMTAISDRSMMRSLLSNLIGNAWKFTTKVACGEIAFSASFLPGDAGGSMVYRIQDNGAGFDMAYAEKLFLPFQRLHSPDEFEGTGIGLATVRKIVERHDGWIRASGVPLKGATVEFTLNAQRP
jgi:PAS domain S-box-containing protein